MAKTKKKRTKKYHGVDAAIDKPHVTRIVAVKKSPLRSWYDDHRNRLAGWGVLIGILFIVYGLVMLVLNLF